MQPTQEHENWDPQPWWYSQPATFTWRANFEISEEHWLRCGSIVEKNTHLCGEACKIVYPYPKEKVTSES